MPPPSQPNSLVDDIPSVSFVVPRPDGPHLVIPFSSIVHECDLLLAGGQSHSDAESVRRIMCIISSALDEMADDWEADNDD